MSENVENDYDINLKIDEKLYHYKSVKKTNIFLNGHIEFNKTEASGSLTFSL